MCICCFCAFAPGIFRPRQKDSKVEFWILTKYYEEEFYQSDFVFSNKTGFEAARCHLQVIVSKPLSSCVFVSFFSSTSLSGIVAEVKRWNPFCPSRFLRHRWQSQEYDVFPYHSVSAAGNLQRGRAPLSGIVLAEPHWFPTGPIPLSKMCLMTFLFCPLRSDMHLLPCTHTHTAASSMWHHILGVSHGHCVSEDAIFCTGVPPLQSATHDAECGLQGSVGGEENSSAFFMCFIRMVTFLT